MYEILKDFAGPVVTIIAAFAAALFAYRLGSSQTRIAESQVNIAFDKLKFDLFEKRYEIFCAAKSLIERIARQHDLENVNPSEIRDLYIKLDEARFFFDDEIRSFLDEIQKLSEDIFVTHAQRNHANMDDEVKWRSLSDKLTNDTIKLGEIYAQLPQRFEKALGFKQLTRRSE